MNKEIIKAYNELVPSEYYHVPYALFESDCKYYTVLSERATGKTTNILLWCLLEYWYTGNTTAYVRVHNTEIKQSIAQELFNVIITNNYITQITKGKYNSIYYKWRSIFLCKIEDNEIKEKDSVAFIKVLSIDEHEIYKSTLNLPNCSTILFDEFITETNSKFDFFRFFDLHSTIVRKRENVKTFLCANTTNVNSVWFKQLLIEDIVRMKKGEKKMFCTEKGTKNYVEILGNTNKFKQVAHKINQLYYGFSNSMLDSITGEGNWSYDYYPVLNEEYKKRNVLNYFYIQFDSNILILDIYDSKELGTIIYIREGEYTSDDTLVFVNNDIDITKDNQYKSWGSRDFGLYVARMYKIGRLFTSTPFAHKIFLDYCAECGLVLR